MTRKQPTTVALVLQSAFDVLGLWGARWALQVAFWFGYGAAVGVTTTLWIAHQLTQ